MVSDTASPFRFTFEGGTTPGLVCAHHHLYSALARGMPPPPAVPQDFLGVLENIWWRLDTALDLEMLEWSAKLGALEALASGCTAIIDHHESPNAIEGSLSVIADACAEVGVRVSCAYGVTDRHGADGARRGLEENDRFLAAGGRGYVGVHAAFTCTDDTLREAADLARRYGVGVHIHVAEGPDDVAPNEYGAGCVERLAGLAADDWLLIHGVNLPDAHGLPGTIVHNPRSNMNNSVGDARPARFDNPIALGTDGIGADMLDEFRLAYVNQRTSDITATPDSAWGWLEHGWTLFPDARDDLVTWNYPTVEPWHLAFTTGVRPVEVDVGGEIVYRDGAPTKVDEAEVRAKAAEQAARLHGRLAEME